MNDQTLKSEKQPVLGGLAHEIFESIRFEGISISDAQAQQIEVKIKDALRNTDIQQLVREFESLDEKRVDESNVTVLSPLTELKHPRS